MRAPPPTFRFRSLLLQTQVILETLGVGGLKKQVLAVDHKGKTLLM